MLSRKGIGETGARLGVRSFFLSSGCTGAVLELYLGYTGGVPETYWSCSGIPGDLSASICLSHIVLLLQSAVVFDIITRTCDNQDLRNEGLKQKPGREEKTDGRNDKMAEVLMKAGSFVAVIIMGNLLRRAGFFKEEDFYVLSKIVLKITLPAAIISNFSGIDLKPSMLVVTLLGFAGGILYIAVAFFMSIGKEREERAFNILNLPGYNIGNFTMPFAQSFLGPVGVVATSLFDTGNAFICLGGAYSAAVATKEKNARFSMFPVIKTLLKSIPFDAYLIMTVLSLLHVGLPAPITSFTGVIGNANAFMAMLMIGVGFKLNGDSSQPGKIVKILAARYSLAIVLALVFYFLLPFGIEYRQALTILALSPMSSAAPAFTGNLGADVGLASAVNSISVVISTVLITGTLMMIL